MKIRIDRDGTQATATPDGATARDFACLLPLTLTLEDYNGTQKIMSAGSVPHGGVA